MNEQEIVRKLNSIGKAFFVNNFSTLKQYSRGSLSKEKCIDSFVLTGACNAAGGAIRCGNAKALFLAKRERDALMCISNSMRLASDLRIEAARLIADECN